MTPPKLFGTRGDRVIIDDPWADGPPSPEDRMAAARALGFAPAEFGTDRTAAAFVHLDGLGPLTLLGQSGGQLAEAIAAIDALRGAASDLLGITHLRWVPALDPRTRNHDPDLWRDVYLQRPVPRDEMPPPDLGRYDCAGRYRSPYDRERRGHVPWGSDPLWPAPIYADRPAPPISKRRRRRLRGKAKR